MKTNAVVDLPPLPAYSSGALYFLDSGDFLFRFRMEQKHHDGPAPEGAKFVTVRDVRAAFGGAEVDTGWISSGILRCGTCAQGDWFIYAAASRKMEVRVEMENGKKRTFLIPVPPTVMVGVGVQYRLWAVTAGGLTEHAPLFHAPFPNVHDSGLICWGQNTPPAAHHRHAETAWKLFFESGFNGDLADGKSDRFKKDVRRMLAQVSRKKLEQYPEEDMVRSPYTLNRALGEFGLGRSN